MLSIVSRVYQGRRNSGQSRIARRLLVVVLFLTMPLAALGRGGLPAYETATVEGLADGIAPGNRTAPAFVDLDNDGDFDLVVGQAQGHIKYFENVGSPSSAEYVERIRSEGQPFTYRDASDVPRNFDVSQRATPTFADLDADNDFDLVVGNIVGELRLFVNKGQPGAPAFECTGDDLAGATCAGVNPFAGVTLDTRATPFLVDLDNDNDFDLVVGSHLRPGPGFSVDRIRYFENTGTSTNYSFTERTGSANPFVAFSDRNTGVFSESQILDPNPTINLADLDGDGDQDAIIGNFQGTLRYLKNEGTAEVPSFFDASGTSNPFLNTVDVGVDSNPAFADIDADNDLDLIVGEYDGRLSYFRNSGNRLEPSFSPVTGAASPYFAVDIGAFSHPVTVDLDGDGDLDAVVAEHAILPEQINRLHFFENSGSPTQPRYRELTGAQNKLENLALNGRSAPAFDDFDNDNDYDLIVGQLDGTLLYFENTGSPTDATFENQSGAANPVAGVSVASQSRPTLGDLDNDGDPDLVVGAADGTFVYALNTGSASAPLFSVRIGDDNPLGAFDLGSEVSPALADVDSDGDLDLIVGTLFQRIKVLVNTGTMTQPTFAEESGGGNPFRNFSQLIEETTIGVGDLDDDGDIDVLAGDLSGHVNLFQSCRVACAPYPRFVFSNGFE